LAVAANQHLKENNDKGIVWVWKMILQLWEFTHAMWEHRNVVLHDTQLESSQMVWNAETNNTITKLYAQVDVFAAEDRWYFDVPLMLRLRKPLRSRCRWLINARILANKSKQHTTIGQMTLNQYYPHLLSTRTVRNGTLEQIASARQYTQTSLLNLWNPQRGDGWKISPSHSLWLGIYLLYLCWCRRPSLYSCQKM
jgi:hypothetical protein